MFDLIAQPQRHPLGGSAGVPVVLSIAGHVVVLGLLVGLPLMYATNTLPKVPAMMTFVADVAAPPPPPAPPAAPRAAVTPQATPRPAPPSPSSVAAAPVEAPSTVEPEPSDVAAVTGEGAIEGGVEGGVEGGIAGGIVGGLVAAPPPPPSPPVQPKAPVRVGGNLQAPALLKRVDPVYPDVALMAKVSGMVILEAVVDEDGSVQSVKVLRSIKLLDNAAIDALKQWKYSPLVLNGVPTPFVVTVTLNFGFRAP